MIQILLTILANWFGRTESRLRKHLAVPREQLLDVEQRLSRRLHARLASLRRAG